jgi:3-hydroxybutyryl-CoA dehydrogenase
MSSAEARRAKDNLVLSAQDADLSECDVVVEAIHEDLKAKQELFRHLSDVCKPETLFHTNTSTLSVTAIAAGASNPERVVGTHYCNPAPLMKLVEVVRGQLTSDDTYSRTIGFIASLDKKSVTTKDVPGFIVNRFLIPFENNCIRSLESGVGTVESIDLAVRHGLRHPMGPFTLLDIVGLDVHRAVSLSLYEQLRDPRFAPPPLVERMVAAGQLGRKVGQGFYNYDQAGLIGT